MFCSLTLTEEAAATESVRSTATAVPTSPAKSTSTDEAAATESVRTTATAVPTSLAKSTSTAAPVAQGAQVVQVALQF